MRKAIESTELSKQVITMEVEVNRTTDVARVKGEFKALPAFQVSEHVRATHTPDGAIALDILHGQMFRLNFVGSRILELFRQGMSQPEIADQLAREFGIGASAAGADVHEFAQTLKQQRLLVASPAAE